MSRCPRTSAPTGLGSIFCRTSAKFAIRTPVPTIMDRLARAVRNRALAYKRQIVAHLRGRGYEAYLLTDAPSRMVDEAYILLEDEKARLAHGRLRHVGVDILARAPDGVITLVRCMCYRKPVTLVQLGSFYHALIMSMSRRHAMIGEGVETRGMIVTTNGLTRQLEIDNAMRANADGTAVTGIELVRVPFDAA